MEQKWIRRIGELGLLLLLLAECARAYWDLKARREGSRETQNATKAIAEDSAPLGLASCQRGLRFLGPRSNLAVVTAQPRMAPWPADVVYRAAIRMCRPSTLSLLRRPDNAASGLERRRWVDGWGSFEVDGCSRASGYCEYQAVCYSARDGPFVFDNTSQQRVYRMGRNNATFDVRSGHLVDSSSGGRFLSPARTPRRLPREHLEAAQHLVALEGNTLVVNCVRQRSANPAHFLMGYGKIFIAAADRLGGVDGHLPPIDNFLFHQCSIPDPQWEWGQTVWSEFLARAAEESGLLRSTQHINLVWLGGDRLRVDARGKPVYDFWARTPKEDEPLICARHAFTEPRYIAMYLAANKPVHVAAWQDRVSRWLTQKEAAANPRRTPEPAAASPPASPTAAPSANGHSLFRTVPGCALSCTSSLNVAAWTRQDNSSRNRRLVNLGAVRRLVAEYAASPLRTVTASAHTPSDQQARLWRSFDVLISTHGSQLVNMIFARRAALVVIELAAMPDLSDGAPSKNGPRYTIAWVSSYGHAPVAYPPGGPRAESAAFVDPALNRTMWDCHLSGLSRKARKAAGINCGSGRGSSLRSKMKDSDLLVDLRRMRRDLERALALRCGCATSVGVEH